MPFHGFQPLSHQFHIALLIDSAFELDAVGEFADAAVVGSAIVEAVERNPGKEAESVAKFIKQLSAVSQQLSVTGGKS